MKKKKIIFKKALAVLTSGFILLTMGGCANKKNKQDESSNESSVTESIPEETSSVVETTEAPTEETTVETTEADLLADKLGDINEESTVDDKKTSNTEENKSNIELSDSIPDATYTGNVYVVDGVAYKTKEDYERTLETSEQPQAGTTFFLAPDGNYYISEEAYYASLTSVTYDEPSTQYDEPSTQYDEPSTQYEEPSSQYDEPSTSSGLYWDEENQIFWESYEAYLLYTGQAYEPSYDVGTGYESYEEETTSYIIGPDGQIYDSIEEYNEKVSGTTSETGSTEETTEAEVVYSDGPYVDPVTGEVYVSYEAYLLEQERQAQENQNANGRQR